MPFGYDRGALEATNDAPFHLSAGLFSRLIYPDDDMRRQSLGAAIAGRGSRGSVVCAASEGRLRSRPVVGGQDFFSRTNLQDDRVEFAAFLSQRVWERGPVQGYATVGTGVNDPGSVVYLGGSAGFSRTLVTVGAATSMIKRGLNPVRDSVFGGTGDRVLFSSLDRQRKWGFFIGLSFAVIH